MNSKISELKRKKSYPVDIDGEQFFLRYDLNSMELLEEKYGNFEDALSIWTAEGKSPSISDVKFLFYIGLKSNHPEITLEDTGAMLDLSNLQPVTIQLFEALSESMPEGKGDGQGNVLKSTGNISDISGVEQSESQELAQTTSS